MQNRYDLLVPETLIPNSSNLNDYITPGHYYTPNAGASQTIQNTPYTTSGFKLIVENLSSTQHVLQTLKAANGKRIFYRTATIVSGSYQWSDWESPVTNADFARGFQSAVNIPANGYADREVSHGLSGTPVSAIATLKVNTTSSSNMANVQIQVNEITSSIIKVRIHNNTSNEATVNFYWAAFL